MRRRSAVLSLLAQIAPPAMAGECTPVDWLALPLPADDPVDVAPETATCTGAGQTTRFSMTGKHCVRQQLQAARDEVAGLGAAMDRYFQNVGGTFNWRRIAGTGRLSSHSFGIAVDFNTRLGGYWRWSGAKPGQAGEMDMPYPPELVAAMERYGVIRGGKWHHFDSFHFEYRPDLILHARLTGG
ncbi:MAG: hypothetical protein CSA74_00860 [Rhodobacterales bacterium]|nr:MAG: hypothetical protein CSA74_00860 [Rhodobacterales bacterium]